MVTLFAVLEVLLLPSSLQTSVYVRKNLNRKADEWALWTNESPEVEGGEVEVFRDTKLTFILA